MAESYQIVGSGGVLSTPYTLDMLGAQLKAGALLPTDQLKTDTGVVTVQEVSALREAIAALDAQLEEGNVTALISGILEIGSGEKTGRLVISSRGEWKALLFCEGQLTAATEGATDKVARIAIAQNAGEQAVSVFKWPAVKLGFFPDESIAQTPRAVWFTARSIVDIGLRSICPDAILRNQVLKFGVIRKSATAASMSIPPFDRNDWHVMDSLDGNAIDARMVSAIASRVSLSDDDVYLRLSILKMAGFLETRVSSRAPEATPKSAPPKTSADSRALRDTFSTLRDQNYFERLSVRRGVRTEGADTAYAERCAALGAVAQSDDDGGTERLRQGIEALLREARDVLRDDVQRMAYNRALQTGVDFSDRAVRTQLLGETSLSHGRTLLNNRDYEQAVDVLARAVDLAPRSADAHIQYGWALFLASDESADAAEKAISAVRRALEFDKESDQAYLAIGKIYRLIGNRDSARNNLNRATQINGDNGEAWAQLRLLNTQKDSGSTIRLQLDMGQGMGVILAFALLVIGAMYVGANVMPGGAAEWPMVGEGAQVTAGSSMAGAEAQLTQKVQERLRGKVDYSIPKDQQVLGNVESFYLVDDAWFWVRRIALIMLALIGIVFISKERLSDLPIFGPNAGWIFAAVPYGVVVGFLSPTPMTPTDVGLVLGMGFVHVLSEQLFFFGFVGRALLKDAENPLLSVFLTALMFGLYQLSYFIVLQAPMSVMLTGLAQITAFAGGAYALLLWRSGGIMAPLFAHLIIHTVMMVRSTTMYAA